MSHFSYWTLIKGFVCLCSGVTMNGFVSGLMRARVRETRPFVASVTDRSVDLLSSLVTVYCRLCL